jgi:protein-disulfide isomerase
MQLLLLLASISPHAVLVDLTPAQRDTFLQVAREEFCHCDSALSLAGCNDLRPECAMGDHLSTLVRAGVQSGTTANEILAYLAEMVTGPFCAPPAALDTSGAPSMGDPGASIQVVEFADFRCGHCKEAAPYVKQHVRARDVHFAFFPFPLQENPEGMLAAEAAFAAHAQGKFWPMHDALFARQDQGFSDAGVVDAAAAAGLDVARFRADMAAHTYRDQVLRARRLGIDAGIQGTPAMFVNGRVYHFDKVLFTLQKRIAMERDRHKGNCQ